MLAEAWSSYAAQVIPRDAPKVQRQESRRAFYAGARSLLDGIMASLDPDKEPTLDDYARMDAIQRELSTFARDVERGNA